MDIFYKQIRTLLVQKKGFTLIELLIVIMIIALISSIGYAVYANSLQSSRDSKRKADIEQLRSALEIYKSDKGMYSNTSSTCNVNTAAGQLDSSYISTPPTDPKSPTYRYCYVPAAPGYLTYSICAHLESIAGSDDAVDCGGANNCGSSASCNYVVKNP